ncbi:MAG: bifunctional precorrin-2 dehydrogenase/sirohydrochlorin ferrochelatase [Intestinibacter sp.]|uniref:precorrin-2 dehydrogenase/sirohydrochlorin ferrochelatase family protein n=1 Tax=Intestinibacter sp. TaxID=1965304 RepID=UPI0025C1396A|nr:bifunctional precorrin-2 dehydrogenase/sirohydrochlorin ferrochelatase [Intestinibacter sp.]MCI6737670.1 bifunctional precorrin-2 dehydrogenase/sirohydrochlorin ferrochelatase [Intestinibacter sp.]
MLYPINLNIDKMKITIIGGGKIAYRKATNFLNFNKTVTVVSNEFIEEFEEIKEKIEMIYDKYDEKYIEDSFVVVAATNNKQINHEIGVYCNQNGKLVNVVDDKELSNFTVPSYVKRGELLLSVSTGGNSPSLSAKIKRELEEKYDESYEEYIELLGLARKKIIEENKDIKERRNKIKALIDLSIDELKEKI